LRTGIALDSLWALDADLALRAGGACAAGVAGIASWSLGAGWSGGDGVDHGGETVELVSQLDGDDEGAVEWERWIEGLRISDWGLRIAETGLGWCAEFHGGGRDRMKDEG
jgi:hypothetical protein